MNYNKCNPRCNSGTKWSCGDDSAVGEDDVDDDPDEARDDDDGDDLPSSGMNFLGRFLPVGELFLSLYGFRPETVAEYFFEAPPVIFRSKRSYMRKGAAKGGTGPPCGPQARPRVGPRLGGVWAPCGPPLVALLSPLVFWRNNSL